MTMLSLRALEVAQQDHQGSSRTKHHSYRCAVAGEDRFLCDHWCRLSVIQETEIIDLVHSDESLHISRHHKGNKLLIEINNLSKKQSWRVEHGKLLDVNNHCIANIASTGAKFQRILASLSELEALPTIITNENHSRVLLAMFKAPHIETNTFNKVVNLLQHKKASEPECLRFKLLSWKHSLSLALALVLIYLHQDEG